MAKEAARIRQPCKTGPVMSLKDTEFHTEKGSSGGSSSLIQRDITQNPTFCHLDFRRVSRYGVKQMEAGARRASRPAGFAVS